LLVPIAAAAGLSLALLGYGAMSPRSQLFGPQTWLLERAGLACALTFDDGPQEPDTSRLLDLMAAEGVVATFFVLGRQAERHPGLLDRMRREGHEVGIHGWSHAAMPGLSLRRMAEELDRTLAVVGRARLVRPPYGWKDRRLFRLAAERNLTVAGWSARGGDWRRARSPEAIAGRILRRMRPGAVVLLHDGCGEDPTQGRERSVAAAGIIIKALKPQGWRFVTL
jgi:peptidoglycan/xylan/chitin deacetylase (PgdA/CDA1 family)